MTGVDLEGIGMQLSLEELKQCMGQLTRKGGEDRSGKDDVSGLGRHDCSSVTIEKLCGR